MNPVRVPPAGPLPADILILGENATSYDERFGEPFSSSGGKLLASLLNRQGIAWNSTFRTNVCEYRPPGDDINEWISPNKKCPHEGWVQVKDKWVHPLVAEGMSRLEKLLSQVQPKIILAVGGAALWALTGLSGIGKWRGSRLSDPQIPCPIVPTWDPAAAVRSPELLPGMKSDLARLKAIHEGRQTPRLYKFVVEPTFDETCSWLDILLKDADAGPIDLSVDIETRRGHIACIGFARNATEAICIPLLRANGFYWTEGEEATILHKLWKVFHHPNLGFIGQNFSYDAQYIWRHWHILPKDGTVYDTMIGHHATFSTMKKGLDFLSSLYAQDHIYWKDESKDWDPKLGESQLWIYNCKDCCITWEISGKIRSNAIPVQSHHDFQQSLFSPVLRMMNRGVRINTTLREKLRNELLALAEKKQGQLDYLAGHRLNPRSSKQLISFFYKDFGLPGIRSMQSEGLTANSQALAEIAIREPILQPVCQLIAELRSIGVFVSTFIEAKLDIDGRMRCSFGIAGTHTNRFNSSENAFGSGANLQNIPTTGKQKVAGANYVKLPNIRTLYIPDPGYEFFDLDLDRADLQVVVWEAEDSDLKLALRKGIDMHCMSACEIFEIKGIPYEELAEDHPNYHEHRGRIGYIPRQKAKMGVHATNYGVGDYKLAQSLGITVREAGIFRGRWFGAHPGIRKWHVRVAQDERRGFTENRFGARLYHLGRFDLPEALAWQPQSTVAGVINRALKTIDAAQQKGETAVELQLQVHDSLAGQYPISTREKSLSDLVNLSRIIVPYEDPLVIPVGIKTSRVSWGDCK